MVNTCNRILVTGGSGMIGKALQRIMPNAYYLTSKKCDLRDQKQVRDLLSRLRPEIIIHLAATVGGIQDNIKRPADYFYDNVLMNTNLVQAAHEADVRHFIGMLSTCIYPDVASSYPIKEHQLHEGAPTPTNFSYGIAKRAMAVHIDALNKQFGRKYSYLILANAYGEDDKFDDDRSHFVGALVKKISRALYESFTYTSAQEQFITLMGTGKPIRQFVYAGDVARIIHLCIERGIYENMNIAGEETYTIDQIASIALEATGNQHFKIKYDTSAPDGQYRKDVSNELLKQFLPDFKFTPLSEGLRLTFQAYQKSIAEQALAIALLGVSDNR